MVLFLIKKIRVKHSGFAREGESLKLSTKGRYGLRALIDLAVNSTEEAVSIQSIAGRQNISDSYLEQLMRLLKKAGLVMSVRGASGGYKLAKPSNEISVGDILRALEGSLDAVTCPSSNDEQSGGCVGSDCCVTKFVWQRINESITDAVDNIMLDELMQQSIKLQEEGKKVTSACEQ